MMRYLLAGLVVAASAVMMLLMLDVSGYAHEAPAGWTYDSDCCSGSDCYELSKGDEVAITAQGYVIRATGETIGFDGQSPTGVKLRKSKDEHFHRCNIGGEGKPTGRSWCLYAPPFGT